MRNWNQNDNSPTLSRAQAKMPKQSRSKPVEDSSSAASNSVSKGSGQFPLGLNMAGIADQEKNVDLTASPVEQPISAEPFDAAATKKLLRKLDFHLIPFLALIYLLCYLDRTNVGNARLVHLEADLGMKGLDYNIALSILFPFYVAAEIPSNIIMNRYRPSIWFTTIMISWGLIMTCMGLVRNFSGLLACRILLGIAEGGLYPGVAYYITMWYRRHECAFRTALFFSAATAAGAFGGLFARGISEMSGVGGRPGWSWIFILEGLLTLIIGTFSFWAINDYPDTARFLTTEERIEVQRRLAADEGLSHEFKVKYLIQAARDWKIWINMFISIGITTSLYSISLFLPTILKELGYSSNTAQLLTIPPYIIACLLTIGGNYVADKACQRGIFLLGFLALAIIGFLLLITTSIPHVQYAGTFLAAGGIFPSVPLITMWNANNIGGPTKRAVGMAMQVGFGNLGGVIAGFIMGHAILISLITMSFVLASIMTIYLRRENARRDALLAARNITLDEYTNEMKWQERENADDALFFRYSV